MATADSLTRALGAQTETTTTGQRRAIRGGEHDVVTPLAEALGFAVANVPAIRLTTDEGLESVARLLQLRLALAGWQLVREPRGEGGRHE